MAIAVIGGLVMSTLLSLVFVPAVFTVLDDLGRLYLARLQPLRRRRGGAAGAPRAGPSHGPLRQRPASEVSVAAE